MAQQAKGYRLNAEKRRRVELNEQLNSLEDKSIDLERIDELLEEGPYLDVRRALTEKVNGQIAEYGVRQGLKRIERALGLRSVHLLQFPGRFDSPRIKLWAHGVEFDGFKGIVLDEYGSWALVFTCTYTGTSGFGRNRRRTTESYTRPLRFDYALSENTDPDALFS